MFQSFLNLHMQIHAASQSNLDYGSSAPAELKRGRSHVVLMGLSGGISLGTTQSEHTYMAASKSLHIFAQSIMELPKSDISRAVLLSTISEMRSDLITASDHTDVTHLPQQSEEFTQLKANMHSVVTHL